MDLNKPSAFETKCENKLLGQGDAVEHQFHAWARDERRRATHSPTENAMEITSRGTLARESGQLCAQA